MARAICAGCRRRRRGRDPRSAITRADDAIEEAGVEIGQAVVRREPRGERALARSGRPVDGDDHARRSSRRRRRLELGAEAGHQGAEFREAGRDRRAHRRS